MARQNMGTPKFYIDMLSYWKAQGNLMQSLMAHQVEIPVEPGQQEPDETLYETEIIADFSESVGNLNPSSYIYNTLDLDENQSIQIPLRQNKSSINNGTGKWDLLTKDNLTASYGVYIYHIEASGIGEKIGKLAIVK